MTLIYRVPSPQIETLVVIQTVSDFPVPVAGVITLAPNTVYQISGEVDISPNRLVFSVRSSLAGTNRVNDRVVSDTTDTLLTGSTGAITVIINELGLRCPNGTLVAFSDVSVAFLNCSLGPCATGGTVATSGALSFTARTTAFASTTTVAGFTFSGTSTGTFRLIDSSSSNCAGTLFDLGTSVWRTIQVANHNADVGAGQTFLAATTGTNLTDAGLMSDCVFAGAGTYCTGFDAEDAPWVWANNIGVTNTSTGGTVAVGDITGLGTGVATWLAVASSANLAAAVTDETGSGALVFATSPVLVTPALGTPTSGVMTNVTGVPAASILSGSFGAGAYVISTSLQVASIELGHATSNTLTASGGVLSVEGVALPFGSGATNEIAAWSGGTTLMSLTTGTYPSLVELAYVKGTTSAIQTQFTAKQDTLVSGTNIKTINAASILGAGDLSVSAADPSYTPGSFTVATETGRLIIKRMQLTTTQRATLTGTARLRLT